MNIIQILHDQAKTDPHRPAIIDTYRRRRRSLSFAELELASARAARLLAQAGLRPGEAVLLLQPMSAELYIALAAIFRLGLVAMFLDPGYGQTYIEQCLALHRPKALVAASKAHLLRLVSPALRRIPHKFAIGWPAPGATPWQRAGRLPPHNDILACDESTPALLTFTSGSTAQPKAALRTHGFLLAQHRALARSLALSAGQVDLTTMPIVALANLASGLTCLIPNVDLRAPGQIDPAPVAAQIQMEGVARIVASPALLERLANYCRQHGLTLPGLKKIFSGGGPVFPSLLERTRQIAPQADIVAVYGSTEAEPIATISYPAMTEADKAAMLAGQGLLAGRPVESIDLAILPDRWGQAIGPYTETEFAARCCPAGEAGEIVVSGDHVLAGYLNGQGDEENKLRVDNMIWHRTGDAGYLDRQRRLWLLGRCAARIEDERGHLYPFVVECAVSYNPAIRRAAVVARRGQRILAVECYGPLPPLSVTTLQETLAWACLDEIRLIERIPVDRRHNAKIDYPALQALLS